MDAGPSRFRQAFRSGLPLDEWLATQPLDSINPEIDDNESPLQSPRDFAIILEKGSKGTNLQLASSRSFGEGADYSPLYRLPEKVRHSIFSYVVTYVKPIPIREQSTTVVWLDYDVEHVKPKKWRFTPPLLRACRQVMTEGTIPFFANNVFSGIVRNSDVSEVTSWLYEMNAVHLRHIKGLEIHVAPVCFTDLLDIGTQSGESSVSEQARSLALAVKQVGLSPEKLKILPPKLKHLRQDALCSHFDMRDAELLQLRVVQELEQQLQVVNEEMEIEQPPPKKAYGGGAAAGSLFKEDISQHEEDEEQRSSCFSC